MLTIDYAVRENEVIYAQCCYADCRASYKVFPIVKVVLPAP